SFSASSSARADLPSRRADCASLSKLISIVSVLGASEFCFEDPRLWADVEAAGGARSGPLGRARSVSMAEFADANDAGATAAPPPRQSRSHATKHVPTPRPPSHRTYTDRRL